MKKQTSKTPVIRKDLEDVFNNYPTKQDLKDELSNYPTKQDLREELSNYPTKDDFKNELSQRFAASQTAFRNELDYKLLQMEERLTEKISNSQNILLTAIDPLMAELETRRQDREISTVQTEEIKAQIDDHEKRISELEHS